MHSTLDATKSFSLDVKQPFDPKEAERIADIARRAEERASKRIETEGNEEKQRDSRTSQANRKTLPRNLTTAKSIDSDTQKIRFRSKEERERDALERLNAQRVQVRVISTRFLLIFTICRKNPTGRNPRNFVVILSNRPTRPILRRRVAAL